jgi:hypothetical protein
VAKSAGIKFTSRWPHQLEVTEFTSDSRLSKVTARVPRIMPVPVTRILSRVTVTVRVAQCAAAGVTVRAVTVSESDGHSHSQSRCRPGATGSEIIIIIMINVASRMNS